MTIELTSPGVYTAALFAGWTLFSVLFAVGLTKCHKLQAKRVDLEVWIVASAVSGVAGAVFLLAGFISWGYLCGFWGG